MSKKRKGKKKRPRRHRPLAPARFPVGTQVRVKGGVTDPDYPDIPLAGWSGTISEVYAERPPTYQVAWDRHTLDAMHPVFRKRCQRDDLEAERMWLGEDDIEPATGEPVPIEQPSKIVTRPLAMHDQDDRIRAIFALTSDDPLPEVDEENLHKYQRYLAMHLAFPFQATYSLEDGPFEITEYAATVVGLSEEVSAEEGLYCQIGTGADQFILPLAEIEVIAKDRNRQLVEDYCSWFWNSPTGEDTLTGFDDFTSRPADFRDFVKVLLKSALIGGIYGVILGLLLGPVESARIGAAVGAAVLALIGGVVGARYGVFFGVMNRLKSGPLLGGIVGAVLGAIPGALAGAGVVALVLAYQGTLGGALAGALFGRLLRTITRKFGSTLAWALAGACLGAIGLTLWRQPGLAGSGAGYGAAAGAGMGMVLFLAAVGIVVFVTRGPPPGPP